MRNKSTHLGDGAYVAVNGLGDVAVTANHHDPEQATDAVYVDRAGAIALLEFLKKELGHE